MPKEKEPCPKCGQLRYMTKHHLKDEDGIKTGDVEIMCRDCHDDAEEEYRLKGITTAAPPKITRNERLKLDYYSGLIPFYATRQASKRIA